MLRLYKKISAIIYGHVLRIDLRSKELTYSLLGRHFWVDDYHFPQGEGGINAFWEDVIWTPSNTSEIEVLFRGSENTSKPKVWLEDFGRLGTYVDSPSIWESTKAMFTSIAVAVNGSEISNHWAHRNDGMKM